MTSCHLETAVRRVGGWCELATSLQGHVPKLYNKDQPHHESLETAVRGVAGWCEMAASLQGSVLRLYIKDQLPSQES
jgi:hypothetical protein